MLRLQISIPYGVLTNADTHSTKETLIQAIGHKISEFKKKGILKTKDPRLTL